MMRRIEGTDPLFTGFLQGDDEVLYHLTDTLRRLPATQITAHGDSFIAVQSSPDVPVWVMSRKEIQGEAAQALALCIREALARNPRIRIFCKGEHMAQVWEQTKDLGLSLARQGGLVAYVLRDPVLPDVPGRLIAGPDDCHREAIARITQHSSR